MLNIAFFTTPQHFITPHAAFPFNILCILSLCAHSLLATTSQYPQQPHQSLVPLNILYNIAILQSIPLSMQYIPVNFPQHFLLSLSNLCYPSVFLYYSSIYTTNICFTNLNCSWVYYSVTFLLHLSIPYYTSIYVPITPQHFLLPFTITQYYSLQHFHILYYLLASYH